MAEDGRTPALAGRRILVLRPAGQDADLADELRLLGATPVVVPALRILPPADWSAVDAVVERPFDWLLFTSANGARLAGSRLRAGVPPGCRIGAIGPATARALESVGIGVDWMPTRYTTAALTDELPGPPARVCLLRADIAGPELDEGLRRRGFDVERVDAYRTEEADPEPIRRALEEKVDAVALTSASIVRALVAAAGPLPLPGAPLVCCIGPATAEACRSAGLDVDCEAEEHTVPGLVAAIAGRLGSADPG